MQKVLRSMILETFPFDLRVKIELLSRKRGIENKDKQEELFKLLREANIDNITPLGSGTNRYAFKLNGFVVKVATDADGKIDNLKEMKMAKRLFPDVTKVYEVTQNGTLLVAEYIQPFQSFGEMQRYADQIQDILKKISQVYLIGDVGLDSKNYANWGLRVGSDSPVCLDFAYIYDAKSDLFICGECNTGSMLVPNSDYTMLVCPNPLCGHKYNFEDIRGRMSLDAHKQEIGDLSEEAYLLSESHVLTELTPNRSNYLKRKVVAQETKHEEKEEEIEYDNFIFNKEEEKMAVNVKATVIGAKAILAGGNIVSAKKVDDVAFSGEIGDGTIIQATSVSVIPKEEPVLNVPKDIVGTINELTEFTQADLDEYSSKAFGSTSTPVFTKDPSVEAIPAEIQEEIKEASEEVKQEKAELASLYGERIPEEAEKVVEVAEGEYPVSEEFLCNFGRCLTKFASKVKDMLYAEEMWDEIHENYVPAKVKAKPAGVFYDGVQSAVFHSLAKFFKMRPVDKEDGKKQWVCNKVEDDAAPSARFLERWYTTRYINDTDLQDSMKKYIETYADYLGIQREWIPDLKRALTDKLKDVEPAGVQRVLDRIIDACCVAPVSVTPDMGYGEKFQMALQIALERGATDDEEEKKPDEEPKIEVEEPAEVDDDMLAFSASVVSKVHDENNDQIDTQLYTEEDSDDEEEDDELNDTEVLIFPEEKVDIIRLKFSDTFGNVEIPFYKKLSDISPDEVIPSLADDRNGDWDWLIHTIPDLRFLTEDPQQWLDLNNDDEFDDTVRFLVLDPDHDGKVLMAMYAINGIFTVDENGNRQVESDPTVLKQLNILFKSEIGNGAISHYARNIMDEDDLIRDEAYAKMVLNGYLPDEDDEGEAEEPQEVAVDTDDDDSEELGILNTIPRRYN